MHPSRIRLLCPICKGEAVEDRGRCVGDHHWIECERCGGTFEIAGTYFAVRNDRGEALPEVSGVLRHAFERHESPPPLTSWSVDELTRSVSATDGRARDLLAAIARRAPRPGEIAVLTSSRDYPLAYAASPSELLSYLSHLRTSGLIEITDANESVTSCTLTVAGLMVVEDEDRRKVEGREA